MVLKVWRIYLLWFLLCVALAGLLWRLIDLNILDRSFLLRQSKARILRVVNIPAYRGMITDRLGTPFAISTPVDSVWVNPQLFQANNTQTKQLAAILGLPINVIQQRSRKIDDHQFVYLKRGNPPDIGQAINALNIPGVFLQREYRRYYPDGEVDAHVVGITNVDDHGQEGLELSYDQWLAGVPGKKEVLIDRLGHVIADVALLTKPVQGHDLTLSLDHRIQYLAYRGLKETVAKYHAEAGSIVVVDVKTGEILAMVNQPSYNPNNRINAHDSSVRNRAVTDMFEPGSVIKPFTVAFALESGKYTPDTTIDTNPGWIKVGGYPIHDDLNYGVVNLTQLLQKSSNIAAAKILFSLPPEKYWNLLHQVGFGERTQSGFPGEVGGMLVPQNTWLPSVVATLAYGYGVSVTTLQLAQAYMILADGGLAKPVTLLKLDTPPKTTRVMPQAIANTVVHMLEAVVQEGTGKLAQVPYYRIAGKTGTSYIAVAKGYDKKRHMSSFLGMAPASNPQLVVAVVIRDPQGRHFGAEVAAPLFAEVMEGSLRLLDIPPDNLPVNQAGEKGKK
jgi:cell division protein FtsI (penicillin-binding protein 3)